MSESLLPQITRRHMLKTTTIAVAASGALGIAGLAAEAKAAAVTNGRIKQSIVDWCFTNCGDKWNSVRSPGISAA
jgi:hypothetical protein